MGMTIYLENYDYPICFPLSGSDPIDNDYTYNYMEKNIACNPDEFNNVCVRYIYF
jgi:hypothetical protein